MQHFSLLTLVLVAAVSGAQRDCYARMDPGSDCGSCHVSGHGPVFGAAGTLYANGNGLAGATVEITDSDGQVVPLASNDVGNFYTPTSLTPPLQVIVSKNGVTASMPNAASGDCNSCHRSDGEPGRIHLP